MVGAVFVENKDGDPENGPAREPGDVGEHFGHHGDSRTVGDRTAQIGSAMLSDGDAEEEASLAEWKLEHHGIQDYLWHSSLETTLEAQPSEQAHRLGGCQLLSTKPLSKEQKIFVDRLTTNRAYTSAGRPVNRAPSICPSPTS